MNVIDVYFVAQFMNSAFGSFSPPKRKREDNHACRFNQISSIKLQAFGPLCGVGPSKSHTAVLSCSLCCDPPGYLCDSTLRLRVGLIFLPFAPALLQAPFLVPLLYLSCWPQSFA